MGWREGGDKSLWESKEWEERKEFRKETVFFFGGRCGGTRGVSQGVEQDKHGS